MSNSSRPRRSTAFPLLAGIAPLAFLVLPAASIAVAPSTAEAAPPVREAPHAESDGEIVVYLIDHQQLQPEEQATILDEIDSIFGDAGIAVDWVHNFSPQRPLHPNELRVVVLPSDGTRWFHGPSNAIGIAPHDDSGIGRNCFVFYRQAMWFRNQAVIRCREAARLRAEAEARGETDSETATAIAPPECGEQLPSLTPLIVARAAAHEMVHILLNKFDHSGAGLMRDSFDLSEWLVENREPFRLQPDELGALRDRLTTSSTDAASGANTGRR